MFWYVLRNKNKMAYIVIKINKPKEVITIPCEFVEDWEVYKVLSSEDVFIFLEAE